LKLSVPPATPRHQPNLTRHILGANEIKRNDSFFGDGGCLCLGHYSYWTTAVAALNPPTIDAARGVHFLQTDS